MTAAPTGPRPFGPDDAVWRLGPLLLIARGAGAAGGRSTAVECGLADHVTITLRHDPPSALAAAAADAAATAEAAHEILLIAPRALALPGVPTCGATAPRRLRQPYADLLADLLRAAPGHLRAASAAEASMLRAMLESILRACRWNQCPPAHEGQMDRERARILALIAANLTAPDLRPQSLATLAGVSRATLHRRLAPLGGVRGCVRAMRLEAARAELLDLQSPPRAITAVAAAWGFADAAGFSRAFRRAYGLSPTELRAKLRREDDPFDD